MAARRPELGNSNCIPRLVSRLAGGAQITTDGYKACLGAIEGAFGGVDYVMLVKIYRPAPEGERHYSPAE